MNVATINRLKKYLNQEQLILFVDSCDCFMAYIRNKSPENLSACKQADERFLESTGGKLPCEIIPLMVWQ